MAKSKKTIAQYLSIYKEHVSNIDQSITRVENERQLWDREHEALVLSWCGEDKVQELFSVCTLETWRNKLTHEINTPQASMPLDLQKMFTDGCISTRNVRDTQASYEKRLAHLKEQLKNVQLQIEPLHEKWKQLLTQEEGFKTQLSSTKNDRAFNNDDFIDTRLDTWNYIAAQGSKNPLQQDYSRPQAWWAQPWILKKVNPTLLQNIEDARNYKNLTGRNLYTSADGYWQRKEKLNQSENEYASSHVATQEPYSALRRLEELNIESHAQRSEIEKALLKNTGNDTLVKRIQVVETNTVKDMLRHCLCERITSLAGVPLAVASASEHSQLLGKEQAIEKMHNQLQTTLVKWNQARSNVEETISKLESLSRKHSRSTQISMDASSVETLSSSMDSASHNIQAKYQQGRNYLSNPTPFANRDDDYYSRQQKDNDSMFWTLAWMHLIMSDSNATSTRLNNETPLLDINAFESKYNGVVGSTDTSTLDLNTTMDSFNVDMPTFLHSDVSVDTSSMNVDTSFSVDTSSSYGSSSSSSDYSSSSSSYDSGSSSSSYSD